MDRLTQIIKKLAEEPEKLEFVSGTDADTLQYKSLQLQMKDGVCTLKINGKQIPLSTEQESLLIPIVETLLQQNLLTELDEIISLYD